MDGGFLHEGPPRVVYGCEATVRATLLRDRSVFFLLGLGNEIEKFWGNRHALGSVFCPTVLDRNGVFYRLFIVVYLWEFYLFVYNFTCSG